MSYPGRSSGREPEWFKTLQTTFSSTWSLILFSIPGLVCVCLLGLSVLFFLAYGFSSEPPEKLTLASLASPAEIVWQENGRAIIEADDLEQAFSALGVTHASNHAWNMALWRQTATGSLSSWFGDNLVDLDRFSRQLRFASLAQETYQQLPFEQARFLKAYTDGVNAVLMDKQHITQDEFALLKITPTPWEPWHSLAIERLFAWLGTSLHAPDSISFRLLPADWSGIQAQNRDLRSWLQLHGFNYSMAGMWPVDSLGTQAVYHRLVYGSAATPAFAEVTLKLPDQDILHLTTIPGTALFHSGQSPSRSWFIFPTSTVAFSDLPDSLDVYVDHERIVKRNQTETLLTLYRAPGWFLPGQGYSPSDSIMSFTWPGFLPGTDLSAFLNLISGSPPTFTLLDGSGLLTEESSWSLLGNPSEIHALGQGVLVGATSWTSYQADRLIELSDVPSNLMPGTWPTDCVNTWARELATFLVEDYLLRRAQPSRAVYDDALTYLRNWDFSYNPASIGATIFETWLDILPDSTYAKAVTQELDPSDSTAVIALRYAVDSLVSTYGSDLSQWRLEITKPIDRKYPAWVNDPRLDFTEMSLSETLFAPLTFSGKGHAATLCWGSFDSDQSMTVSARWDGWSLVSPDAYRYQWRHHDVPNSMLSKYTITNTPSTSYWYDERAPQKNKTRLTGASND